VRSAVYDDCPYCKGKGKVKSTVTMSVEIQRKLQEILKKRTRDENDFQLRIVVHPTVLDRLRTEDEKHLIEMEKRYFGKLSFRADTGMHAEQFKIVNVESGEELASVGSQTRLKSKNASLATVRRFSFDYLKATCQANLRHLAPRSVFGLALQKAGVPPLMNQSQKPDRVVPHFVIQVEREWFCPTAGKAMRTDVVAAFPADDFPRLSGHPLA
jgi:hypothetical protein